MGSRSSWRRVRVERGIYLLPNGKYAVVCRRAGRQRYRTVGSDLALARSEREALIAAAEAGVAPASPRVRFGTVAGWWLERFEAKVSSATPAGTAGSRSIRSISSNRTSARDQRGGSSGCSAATRSSACSPRARRATG